MMARLASIFCALVLWVDRRVASIAPASPEDDADLADDGVDFDWYEEQEASDGNAQV